ncbi:hypothetical protein HYG84_00270 [Alkaliphilus sp. B6464]|nr:hypothetical protein HYG84_00270 [Alkaliphilus sp. B6464]
MTKYDNFNLPKNNHKGVIKLYLLFITKLLVTETDLMLLGFYQSIHGTMDMLMM